MNARRRNRLAGALVAVALVAGAGAVSALTSAGSREISQDSSRIAGRAEPADFIGVALAAGDFDGDGFDDVIVGGPYEDLRKKRDAGQIHVMYGSKNGIRSRDKIIHQGTKNVVGKSTTGDRFGAAVAVGDFNLDGFDDVAVGVPGKDLDGKTDAGNVVVLYGRKKGLSGKGSTFISQRQVEIGGDAGLYHEFGQSLTVGDFNGDRFMDLAIGVPGDSSTGNSRAGAVSIVYGSASGLTAAGSTWITQDEDGVSDISEVGDQMGWSLAAGNFDGDDYDDLAIGVPGASKGRRISSGIVQVLRGSGAGLTGIGAKRLSQAGRSVPTNADAGDDFGWALAVGDFNNNGRDDLAVGAPGERVGSVGGAGVVHVFFGRSAGISKRGNQMWQPGVRRVPGRAEGNAGVGRALAAGDFDGDGRDDLAVGSPGRTVTSDAAAGAFLVIYG